MFQHRVYDIDKLKYLFYRINKITKKSYGNMEFYNHVHSHGYGNILRIVSLVLIIRVIYWFLLVLYIRKLNDSFINFNDLYYNSLGGHENSCQIALMTMNLVNYIN